MILEIPVYTHPYIYDTETCIFLLLLVRDSKEIYADGANQIPT